METIEVLEIEAALEGGLALLIVSNLSAKGDWRGFALLHHREHRLRNAVEDLTESKHEGIFVAIAEGTYLGDGLKEALALRVFPDATDGWMLGIERHEPSRKATEEGESFHL